MLDRSAHVDEGTIHAWLDGALPADERVAVEAHVAACPACATAVAEARGLIAASARILSSLDDVPAGVIPNATPASVERIIAAAAAQPARPAAPAWSVRRYAPLAAAAVIVIVGSVVWKRSLDRYQSAVVPSAAVAITKNEAPVPAGPNAELPVVAPTASAPPPAARPSNAVSSTPADRVAAKEKDAESKPAEAQGAARAGAAVSGFADSSKEQRIRSMLGAGAAGNMKLRSADAATGATTGSPEKKVSADVSAAKALDSKSEELTKRGDEFRAQAQSPSPARQEVTNAPAPAPPRAAAGKQRDAGAAVGGVVIDAATGRPLEGAQVTVAGMAQSAATSATGEFFIPGVSPGAHTLTVRRIGFATDSQHVDVSNERAASVTLSLSSSAARLSEVTTISTDSVTAAFGSAPRTIEGLMLLTTETSESRGSVVRRSVYEVRPGVRVTLVETRPLLADKLAQSRREQTLNRAVAPSVSGGSAAVESVEWTARDGATMTLSGPLTKTELAAIRARIP